MIPEAATKLNPLKKKKKKERKKRELKQKRNRTEFLYADPTLEFPILLNVK